ncbi:enoyl-CoA hydratase-related protein [Brevibacillus laterosporus]|uniref:Enoyl-CoA hydratase-related protein n=1 Tax=Brevibacillus halotolerans TaxID=1507437 RepID=A0ABT4HS64_9BACL|nr:MULTISPECIES: enoyl-CoA hydratase-related protein [Brevibacillus]MCR8983897.1 enoyl-CoA hydratase-related protein [Brevibacillus laterosporus]MCZ0829616.1 enoyl-CoA hydratase-related protein [Brevibacillus halotolerans]
MTIQLEKQGQVGILTIQRPEVYNCLNLVTLERLQRLLLEVSTDMDIRVVIITGAGDKAFCSGADLKERKTMQQSQVQQYIRTIRDVFTQVERLSVPVIAAMNGIAFGGGLELALACDLRVMSETAETGLTETSLGIIPGAGGTQRLPRLIGKGKAKELILTARRIGAKEALEIGLVNQIVPANQVLEASLSLAQQISLNAPLALAQAKWAIDYGMEVDMATGLALESNAYQILVPTKDRLEGLGAFAEKRKPVYRGE